MAKLDYSKRKPNGLSVGDIRTNKEGLEFEVVAYESSRRVKCRFLATGYITGYVQAGNVVRGMLKDLYSPAIEGVGYVGAGDAPVRLGNKVHPLYRVWKGMFIRCYSENYHKTRPTYIGCSVVKEWHCYQNFYHWASSRYKEDYQLDKDILFDGNKVYSPDSCVFVPQEVNMVVTDNKSNRGDCPIGVSKRRKKGTQEYNGLYTVACSTPRGAVYLGRYTCPVKGFEEYKEFKEFLWKCYGETYYDRGMITLETKEALLQRKVLITD